MTCRYCGYAIADERTDPSEQSFSGRWGEKPERIAPVLRWRPRTEPSAMDAGRPPAEGPMPADEAFKRDFVRHSPDERRRAVGESRAPRGDVRRDGVGNSAAGPQPERTERAPENAIERGPRPTPVAAASFRGREAAAPASAESASANRRSIPQPVKGEENDARPAARPSGAPAEAADAAARPRSWVESPGRTSASDSATAGRRATPGAGATGGRSENGASSGRTDRRAGGETGHRQEKPAKGSSDAGFRWTEADFARISARRRTESESDDEFPPLDDGDGGGRSGEWRKRPFWPDWAALPISRSIAFAGAGLALLLLVSIALVASLLWSERNQRSETALQGEQAGRSVAAAGAGGVNPLPLPQEPRPPAPVAMTPIPPTPGANDGGSRGAMSSGGTGAARAEAGQAGNDASAAPPLPPIKPAQRLAETSEPQAQTGVVVGPPAADDTSPPHRTGGSQAGRTAGDAGSATKAQKASLPKREKPREPAADPDSDVTAVGEVVTWIQARLARLGYYDGAISGRADAGTRRAIEAYQRSRNLTATGNINEALLVSLRRAQPESRSARRDRR